MARCEKIEVIDLVQEGVYLIVEECSIGLGASDAHLILISSSVDGQAVRFRGRLSEVKEVWTETNDSSARQAHCCCLWSPDAFMVLISCDTAEAIGK